MVSDEEENKKSEENQDVEGKNEKSSEEIHSESPVTHRIRNNPWILSTIVLGILVIILLAGVFESNPGERQTVNIQNVGEKVEDFYEHYGVSGVAVSNVEVSSKDEYFYKVNVMYRGQEVPFYVTKSGHMAGNYLVSINPDENGNYKVDGFSRLAEGGEASSSQRVTEVSQNETSKNP